MMNQEETRDAAVLLCSITVGQQRFGVDTRQVREVLATRSAQWVPLAPKYIAGVVSYRGEVLTTVSLRTALGLDARDQGCILVLEAEGAAGEATEQFGLMVDDAAGALQVDAELLKANLIAAPDAFEGLCCGAYRTHEGLLVELDARRLRPETLARRWVTREPGQHSAELNEGSTCAH